MDLWDAIKEMRRLSAEGVPFGFTFMSYDATARASKGVIEVRHARLLKREKQEPNSSRHILTSTPAKLGAFISNC